MKRELATLAGNPYFSELTHIDLPDNRGLRWYSGYLLSNDRRYGELVDNLGGLDRDGGIGVFVGAGNTLSMLPDLNLDLIVSVDLDPAVIAFNSHLTQLIVEGESPEQVLDDIDVAAATHKDRSQNILPILRAHMLSANDLKYRLQSERNAIGDRHWSNPDRFKQVQDLIPKTNWLRLVADIRNPKFARYLGMLSATLGRGVSFANMTNVHGYTGGSYGYFMEDWPVEDDLLIVYSTLFSGPESLSMLSARSVEEYIGKAYEAERPVKVVGFNH
jgi:hypothetical protein